jgi:hypothetical protein
MRKIESLMNDAIKASQDWKLDNTEVTNEGNITRVFLYDNQIATIGETWIQLFDGKHQTATTKSRLNAILKEHGVEGDYVFQKAGKWFVNYNGSTELFSNGMKLA